MNRPWAFALLLAFQLACAFFFLWQIFAPMLGLQKRPIAWALYELIELGAGVGLVVGVAVTGTMLRRALKRQADAEHKLRMASGAFMEVLEQHFADWGLTPAERDVAFFSLKGLSMAEIAGLRKTSEGTVKAQSAAIYRKAGVTGRAQLLSLFIEELIDIDTGAASLPRPADAA
ncbi:MAG: helix-turn-helix transcriptional regulator [Roseivivax sp.]|nr:helix-turn-helix transcriptional regulator [Roseivivax sp.]